MLEKGDTVFIAASGGCDSTTLLHLLTEIAPAWKLKLGILHVNHKLSGKASNQDEAFVRNLARRFKIPVFVARLPVEKKMKEEKISLEEAAREERYHFFEKTAEAKGARKIFLAHTQDDQAETVLMRIINGTGLQGLQAIRPKRKLNNVYIMRPFIEISRNEIRRFAQVNSIRFREDKSNWSLQFLRNRIRLKLLPFLEHSFNPQVKKALARLPHLLDVDLAFLEETADIFYKRLAKQRNEDEVAFPKRSFLQLRPSIQYRLIGRALRTLAEAELDFEHWNTFLERLTMERHFQLQLPKGILAAVSSEVVCLKRSRKHRISFSYPLFLGKPLYIPEIDATLFCELLSKKPRVLRKTDRRFDIFDGTKLSFPLLVRNRKAGDRFQPLGQSKPVKLKGFLISRHIPFDDRDCLPLVVSGDRLAWVGGIGMGEIFKVTNRTKQFIRILLRGRDISRPLI